MSDEKNRPIDQTVDQVTQASVETSRIEGGIGETVDLPTARVGATSRSLPEVGENLGRYKVIKLLGQGGMGAVFLAHDPTLDRKVALKIPFLNANNADEVLHRFQREARAVAALHHPNICPVHEVTEDRGIHFMVMAFIEGRPLSDYLKKAKRFKVASAINLVRKLALTLDEAHRKGVIHRDLKPANIMIDARSEPQIMDFGLARLDNVEASQLTAMGQILGTPAYMPPEQVSGNIDATGASSDIYSLGVMLYEMLTGQLPFAGDLMSLMYKIANETPAPASNHRESIPPWLDKVCAIALAKKPCERFASMKAFADALQGEAATRDSEATLPIGAVAASAVPAASLPHLTIDTSPIRKPQVASRGDRGRIKKRNYLIAAAALPLFLLAGGWIIKITNSDGTVQEITVPEDAKVEIAKSEATKTVSPTANPDVKLSEVDPSRAAVAEIFKAKGSAEIEVAGVRTWVADPNNLPGETFVIKQVRLSGDYDLETPLKLLSKLNTVTHLSIYGGQRKLSVETFEAIGRMSSLEDMFTDDVFIDDERFTRLRSNTSLRRIAFWYNSITDGGLPHVNKFPSLEELHLGGGPYTGDGLKELRPMHTLKMVSFHHSSFADESIPYLDRFPNAKVINLGGSKVTSEGIKKFPDLTSLSDLSLNDNGLSVDDCLSRLKQLPELAVLQLDRTGITDKGLQELCSWTHLKKLDINDCNVTPEAVDRLQDALPNCKISTNAMPTGGWPAGLRFDGNDVVRTRLKYGDPTPITIEFRAMQLGSAHGIVANWESNGVGIDVYEDRWAFSYHNPHEFCRPTSKRRVIVRKLYNVAGVFDGSSLALFVDGELQSRISCVGHRPSTFPFMIGGEPDSSGNPDGCFDGIIQSVRISDVARYTEDYDATVPYMADDSTLLMLDFTRSESELAKDMSKYNVPCEIVGATPVVPD